MERSNKPQKLDELIPQTYSDSSTAKLDGAHRRIIQAKESDSGVCTDAEFRKIVGTICVGSGLKELPSSTLYALLYSTYLDIFSARINKHELQLAFTLNMTGQLQPKVEHYQLFSVEFMSNVLNNYITKRQAANIEHNRAQIEKQKELPPPDITISVLEQILSDLDAYHATGQETFLIGFPVATKLEYMHDLVNVDYGDANIEKLRNQAIGNIIARLNNEKRFLTDERKAGALLAKSNQVVRMKSGKCITERDESEIQGEVRRLLYKQLFDKLPRDKFIAHVKETIRLNQ